RAGRAVVSHGRSGALSARRPSRVSRPVGPAGEGTRIPHRVGRDRSGVDESRSGAVSGCARARKNKRQEGGGGLRYRGQGAKAGRLRIARALETTAARL